VEVGAAATAAEEEEAADDAAGAALASWSWRLERSCWSTLPGTENLHPIAAQLVKGTMIIPLLP
jgi:hypothetical protein